MDGVSWSATRAQESFSRSRTATDTLSRLASFIARADPKPNQKHPPSQPVYVCPECGKGFNFATELLHHQELQHTLPKPHRCPSCGLEFSLRSSLQLHQCPQDAPSCEPRVASPRPACTSRTSEAGKPESPPLQPHLLDGSPYPCAPCGRGFSHKQALLHHQQAGCSEPPSPSGLLETSGFPDESPAVSEGDSTRSDSSDTPGPSRHVMACPFCLKPFHTEVGLQRHQRTNHREERLTAPQRHRTKETSGRREESKRAAARMKVDPNSFPKPKKQLLSCRSCDMVFRSTSKLYMHRKEKHSREKNAVGEPWPVVSRRRNTAIYPCQLCSKLFFHHLSLRAHCRQQHAASAITAGSHIPGLSENTANPEESGLDHGAIGAGPGRPRKVDGVESGAGVSPEEEVEREFPCPSCAEVFSVRSQLREHVELHQSSVKTRQCSVCTNEIDACKGPGSKRQRLYHCVPCQQGFSALDAFLEHCQEHLRVRVEEDCISEAFSQLPGKV